MSAVTSPTTGGAVSKTVPKLNWPTGTPSWQKAILDTLYSKGHLGTVPPQVLAWLSKWESDFGNSGVGINTSGFGGYFGLGTATMGKGVLNSSTLKSSAPGAYAEQAVVSASTLSSYGHSLLQDLNEYVTGNPTVHSAEATSVVTTSGASNVKLAGFPYGGLSGLGSIANALHGFKSTVLNTTGPLAAFSDLAKVISVPIHWFATGFGIGWPSVFSVLLGVGLVLIGLSMLGAGTVASVLGKVGSVV